jgi:hypothetical protein
MGCGASSDSGAAVQAVASSPTAPLSSRPLCDWSATDVDRWLLSLSTDGVTGGGPSLLAAYCSTQTQLAGNNGAFLVKLAAMSPVEANAKLHDLGCSNSTLHG